jgi:integrase
VVRQATRETPTETARVTWGKSDQSRFMREACAAAKIVPAASFHELRHTYASRLAMRGVPMGVIAAQLGHADTRMTERHYAHLSPSYVAETVRQSFGTLGIVQPTNGVVPLRRLA